MTEYENASGAQAPPPILYRTNCETRGCIYRQEAQIEQVMPFLTGFICACLMVVYVVLFCFMNKVGVM